MIHALTITSADTTSDWYDAWGRALAAVQGTWGGATKLVLEARLRGEDSSRTPIELDDHVAQSRPYTVMATFTPDDTDGLRAAADLTGAHYDYRWIVTGANGSTKLQGIVKTFSTPA